MSFRKTKLIQEKNILLERKYILEQAPPPPPPSASGTPPPPTAPTPPSTGQTSNNVKKFTESEIKTAPHCSRKPFKIDATKYEKKEEKINGVAYTYYMNEKKDMVLCRDKPN